MKRRLLVSYLSITAFVLLVLEIPLGVSYANSVERRLTSDLQHDAFALAIRSQRAARPTAARAEQTRALRGARRPLPRTRRWPGRDRRRRRPQRRRLGSPAARPVRDFSDAARDRSARSQGGEVSGTRSSQTLGDDLLYVALPIGSVDGIQGAVRITYPASIIDDQHPHIWLLLAATGGVVLGIVFLASLLLARSMTKPLQRPRGRGRVSSEPATSPARAEVPRGPAELTVLAESFNATACTPRAARRRAARVHRRRVAPAAHAARGDAPAAREPRSRRARRRRRGPRGRARRGGAPLAPRRRPARARTRRAVVVGAGADRGRRGDRRALRRVGRVRRPRSTCTSRPTVDGLARGRGDAGSARAGRRQPAEQRARGRARGQRGAASPRRARRLGRAAGERRGPGHVGRRARPRVRPLLAVGRGAQGRAAQRPLRPRPLDRARARGRRRRRRRARAVGDRRPRGGRADAAQRRARARDRATSASVSSRPPPRPERRRR